MKIVVMDGFLVCRGDLDFEKFRELGELEVYPQTGPTEIAKRIRSAQAVLCNRTPLTREILLQAKELKYIGLTGTGYNIVDLRTAKELGITVCNVPDYSSGAVAEMAFALLFEITKRTALLDAYIHAGKWRSDLDETVAFTQSMELFGKTMGIVGLGDIGSRAALIAGALGMRVLGCRRPGNQSVSSRPVPAGVTLCSLEELLEKSDVVSIHCPLNDETRGLINAERLGRMKRGAILINTARGAILEEAAVAAALDSGRLYAAGLDVLPSEPPREGSLLAYHPRCVVTPHVAWAPVETRARLLRECWENLRCFLEGNPRNVVG